MKFLLEFKSFLKEGDTVLIEYWYNDMVTPVKIVEAILKHISSRMLQIQQLKETLYQLITESFY